MTISTKLGLFKSVGFIALLIASGSRVQAGDVVPTNGVVSAGAALIGTLNKGVLTITQSSNRAVVDWNSFSIGSSNSVNFVQPDSSAAILNRVTGSTTSTIAGSLNANGSIYLVNPNGIQITKSGVVNVGNGFVASTLDILNTDFIAGKNSFTGNGASGAVTNEGSITTLTGGFVGLLGGSVSNSGVILAPMGKIGLGSGEQATLDVNGDQFLQVAVPTGAQDAQGKPLVSNSGQINARGGRVELKAATARAAVRDAIYMPGSINANSVSGKDGQIVLDGGEGGTIAILGAITAHRGSVAVSGANVALTGAKINVASKKATGGSVVITAKNDVSLKASTIIASGATGGGKIRIGGDFRGGGAVPTAGSVHIDKASVLNVDAINTGNGGTVAVWSNGMTQVNGLITARGGANGGNGGQVETSGHQVDFAGLQVNTSAPSGKRGLWLVDPIDLTIDSASAATISAALASSDVTLETTASTASGVGVQTAGAGDIIVNSAISWSTSSTLTLTAYNAITINAPIKISGGGGLTLSAAPQAGITTTGLTFGSGGRIDYGTTDNGGTFHLNGQSYSLIYTMADLEAVSLTENYALATNLSNMGFSYNGALIAATGSFDGRLDGLGHTITGLLISAGGADNVGLIGTLGSDGVVSNLGLIGGSVTGGYNTVGSLVGTNSGTVEASYATGPVSGIYNVGGLVGNNTGVIQSSYATGSVDGTSSLGGLVGINIGTIQSSYATGQVSAEVSYSGGLVGYNLGTIQTSYATGQVSGLDRIGGLAGFSGGYILSSYATGDVTATGTESGGLVGVNDGTITTSFATGNVVGADQVGGLVGLNNSGIESSYATGNVNGGSSVGALVGIDFGRTSSDSHAITTAQLQGTDTSQPVNLGADFSGGAAGGTTGINPYLIANQQMSLATLTITASDATATYGTTYTLSGYTWSGLLAGDTINSVYLSFNGGATATTSNTAAGGYTITASGAVVTNASKYKIVYTTGALTVTPLAVTVTGTQIYDGTTNALASNLTVSNAVGSDVVTLTGVGALYSPNAGVVNLVSADGTLTGLSVSNPNYTVVGGAGSVSVKALPVIVTGTQIYNGTLNLSGSNLTVSNKVGSDVVTVFGLAQLDSPNVGMRTIRTAGGVLGGGLLGVTNTNYTLKGGSGSVNVTPAPITVTALGGTSVYGAVSSNPGLSATGLQNGEAVNVLTGLTNNYAINPTTSAGTYTTSVTGTLTNTNYSVTSRVDGTWNVTPAKLMYVADAISRNVGVKNPVLTGSVKGFVGSDTLANATSGKLGFTSSAMDQSLRGSYPILGSGLAANNGNYVFVQAAGNSTALTIAQSSVSNYIKVSNLDPFESFENSLQLAAFHGKLNGDINELNLKINLKNN